MPEKPYIAIEYLDEHHTCTPGYVPIAADVDAGMVIGTWAEVGVVPLTALYNDEKLFIPWHRVLWCRIEAAS